MFSRRSDVCSSHLTPSTERQDPRGSGVKHPSIPRSSSSSSCDCGAKHKNKRETLQLFDSISRLTSIRLKPVSPRLRSPKIMRNDPFAPSSQSISSPTREVDAMEKQSLGSSKTGTSSFYAERERQSPRVEGSERVDPNSNATAEQGRNGEPRRRQNDLSRLRPTDIAENSRVRGSHSPKG